VARAVDEALGVLRKMTAAASDVMFPQAGPIGPIVGPEVNAYHAKSIAETPERYQPLTRARIRDSAAAVSAAGYAQALYQMHEARRSIAKVFSNIDIIVMPTMIGIPALIKAGADADPFAIRNTYPFDYFGLPTISVPCGFTQSGLPIGLQLSGAPLAESTVLALAHAYERETGWETKRPRL